MIIIVIPQILKYIRLSLLLAAKQFRKEWRLNHKNSFEEGEGGGGKEREGGREGWWETIVEQ